VRYAGDRCAKLPHGLLTTSPAIVIDTGNYYPSRDGRITEVDERLAESAWVAQVLGRSVVKAFDNFVAASLATRAVPAGTAGRICLAVAGDEIPAKEAVLRFIDGVGFDGIDAGTLGDSWRQQPGAPAYCRDLDTKGLMAAVAEANPALIGTCRARADEMARPYFA